MLGGNVNANLQAALAQNWFAIGLWTGIMVPIILDFDGWNEANKPYLVIDYTYTPTLPGLKLRGNCSCRFSCGGKQSKYHCHF